MPRRKPRPGMLQRWSRPPFDPDCCRCEFVSFGEGPQLRVELGIHGLKIGAATCLEKSEKRGAQAARLPLVPGGTGASFPISHIKPFARSNATESAHLTLACVLLPPAGNWVRFACPIPPRFVLNGDLPMTNTTANWLRFGAFRSPPAPPPPASLMTGHILSPHAPRPTPHAPRLTPHDRRGPPSMSPPSRLQHPPAGGGQHATKCYVFWFWQKFVQLMFRRKLI